MHDFTMMVIDGEELEKKQKILQVRATFFNKLMLENELSYEPEFSMFDQIQKLQKDISVLILHPDSFESSQLRAAYNMGYKMEESIFFSSPSLSESVLISEQRLEDEDHYKSYEQSRIHFDKMRLNLMRDGVRRELRGYLDLGSLGNVDVAAVVMDYDIYSNKCRKLGLHDKMNVMEYAIYKKHPMICGSSLFIPPIHKVAYMVHHEPTAKYLGNTMEKIKQEFKHKWY